MPKEAIKEFIGKKCKILTISDNIVEIVGIITSVEDNWIKLQEKNTIRLINGDMIESIQIVNK